MRTGLQDGSTKAVSAEGCEFGPPGAPPLPIDAMLGICKNMVGALPDWKSLCLGIEKNEDGTYTVLTQQCCGAMKAEVALLARNTARYCQGQAPSRLGRRSCFT